MILDLIVVHSISNATVVTGECLLELNQGDTVSIAAR